MTIDEAIAKERKLVEIYRNDIVPKEDYHNMPWNDMLNKRKSKAAEEHEQLAEWLRELKDYRDKNKWVVRIDIENMDSIKDKIEELSKYAKSQYNKGISDFAEKLKRENKKTIPTHSGYCGMSFEEVVDEIADQLKGE